jgi:hypothetical protein
MSDGSASRAGASSGRDKTQVDPASLEESGFLTKGKLRLVLVTAGVVAVLLGVGAAAGAAIANTSPVSGGVINACYKTAAASNGSHSLKLENTGTACPSGFTNVTWNKQGQSGVVSMIQYQPNGAGDSTGSWAFLGSPPEVTFTNTDTAAEVTASVDEASQDGKIISSFIGVCDELVGSSTVNNVTYVEPEFVAGADDFFAQSVSGDVGNLSAGTYYVGLCAENQSDVYNGIASVTITVAQTPSGVAYDSPRASAPKRGGTQ